MQITECQQWQFWDLLWKFQTESSFYNLLITSTRRCPKRTMWASFFGDALFSHLLSLNFHVKELQVRSTGACACQYWFQVPECDFDKHSRRDNYRKHKSPDRTSTTIRGCSPFAKELKIEPKTHCRREKQL